MTTLNDTELASGHSPPALRRESRPRTAATRQGQQAESEGQRARHRGHGWMMIACCLPMIAIAVALWAAGVVGPGLLVAAFACIAMMALMMGGMNHGGAGHSHADEETRR